MLGGDRWGLNWVFRLNMRNKSSVITYCLQDMIVAQSIPLRHALVASSSISSVCMGPFRVSSSIASTTASATESAFSGFSTAAPSNGERGRPRRVLSVAAGKVPYARGTVKKREESYRKPGRMKILRMLGKREAMVDSASRLVVR